MWCCTSKWQSQTFCWVFSVEWKTGTHFSFIWSEQNMVSTTTFMNVIKTKRFRKQFQFVCIQSHIQVHIFERFYILLNLNLLLHFKNEIKILKCSSLRKMKKVFQLDIADNNNNLQLQIYVDLCFRWRTSFQLKKYVAIH